MMNLFYILAAFTIDLIIGDPVTPLHPVRLMGALIHTAERVIRRSPFNKGMSGGLGVVVVLAVITGSFLLAEKVVSLLPFGNHIFPVFIFYISFALKDLARHGLAVKRSLISGDLEEARILLSYMVSRETACLTEQEIIRGTVESISENTSDSIFAPLFWGLLLGPLGALLYRAINTLDAMWGYKNEQYIAFGRTAAKLDDAVNYLPARITGVFLCTTALFTAPHPGSAWKIMLRDHKRHASPNAGYPEAAVAGALGIQLGGPGRYFGKKKEKPTIGEKKYAFYPDTITDTIKLMVTGTFIFLLTASTVSCLFFFLIFK